MNFKYKMYNIATEPALWISQKFLQCKGKKKESENKLLLPILEKNTHAHGIQTTLLKEINSSLLKTLNIYFLIFQVSDEDLELCRSYSGSMLPLIFGVPFAPELKNPYSPIDGQQATLARKILTFWANFATSG